MSAILITGGCGFIGSFFCEKLLEENPESTIVILDAMYDCASFLNLSKIHEKPNVKFYKGQLQNNDLVSLLFKQYKFEKVAHFAAQTHVDTSFHSPLQFTYDNVVGIHSLLEVIRQESCVKRFLHISTDEVYGSTSDSLPNTVESLLEPSNPYAATKAAAEMLVKSYIHSFSLPAVIIRMNNVYGPRQFPEKMIPKFLLAIRAKQPIQIQGSGFQKRSMLYIDDAIEAIYTIYKNGEVSKIYNIPSVDEFTVLEIAEKVMKATGEKQKILFVEDRPFNDKRYWLHDTLLENLGWKQKTRFEEGLEKTKQWYFSQDISKYWEKKST